MFEPVKPAIETAAQRPIEKNPPVILSGAEGA